MIIRPYRDNDHTQVVALVSTVNSQEYGFEDKVRLDLQDIKETYLLTGAFFVCEHEQEIIGCVGLERAGQDIKLRRMHVKKTVPKTGSGRSTPYTSVIVDAKARCFTCISEH